MTGVAKSCYEVKMSIVDHCCIKYENVTLLKMLVLFLLTWQVIIWILGYTNFNFVFYQVVGLLVKLEHLIPSPLLGIFTLIREINEALLSMANLKKL